MVTRTYVCTVCHHQFDVVKSIKEEIDEPCQACGQKTETVIYGGINASIKREATTLGQQAERNSKKMGKTKIQEVEATSPEKPFQKSDRRQKIEKVLKRDKAGIEKYIMTGK